MKTAYFLIISIFVASIALIVPPKVSADPGGSLTQVKCDNVSAVGFTAGKLLSAGSYDVYVKLGKRGQSANVNAFSINQPNSECSTLVSDSEMSGGEWRRISSFTVDEPQTVIFQLFSDEISASLDANRPSMLLINNDNPICSPNPQCELSINGEVAVLEPSSALLSTNSLRLVTVDDPRDLDVEEVRYFLDDKLQYTTETLEPFDMRYAVFAGQDITRVIEYESGQLAIFEDTVPESYTSSFGDFMFRVLRATGGSTILISTLVVIAVAALIARWIIVRKFRQQQWNIDHGLATSDADTIVTDQQREEMYKRERIIKLGSLAALGFGAIVFTILSIVLINSFVLKIYRVEGVSMQDTIQDGSWTAVNRIPKTVASLNRQQYTPQRGEVVVVDAVYGLTDTTTAEDSKQSIIKRVIGLPGERVTLKDGIITVYNKQNPQGFNPDQNAKWADTMRTSGAREDIDIQLGSDELFVSGDNRPESIDSRYNGPLDIRRVVGPLLIQP